MTSLQHPRRRAIAVAAVLGAAVVLAGCSGAGAGSEAAGNAGVVRVVASTDVYGDIAEQIGGPAVEVHSLIDSPDRDPHEFQADARDQLAIAKARLVIVNGGGYDDFMQRMLRAAPGHPAVITVAGLAAATGGRDSGPGAHTGGSKETDGEKGGAEANEHFWYDMAMMRAFARHLAAELSEIAPDHAHEFATRAASFDRSLKAIQHSEAELKARYAGVAVAITEPLPLAMVEAVGLANRTPAAFSEAVENGTGAAPGVLRYMLDLMQGTRVAALILNSQAAGAQTGLVRKAAQRSGVPVVEMTETLPAGEHYAGWMRGNLAHLGSALKRAVASGLVTMPKNKIMPKREQSP